MYILVPVWLQVLQGLALLPFAICVILWARQQSRRQSDSDAMSRLETARLRGYMSNQGSHLDEIQIAVGNVQRLVESLCIRAEVPVTAMHLPVLESMSAPEQPSGQWSPSQLSRLRQHLGKIADGMTPISLPLPQQPQEPGSLPESLVKDSPQEPEISHGGE